jgi:hypothetical protein
MFHNTANFKILSWNLILKSRSIGGDKDAKLLNGFPHSVLFNPTGDSCFTVGNRMVACIEKCESISAKGPIHSTLTPWVEKGSNLTHMFVCMRVVLVGSINFSRGLATQKDITGPHSNKI